MYTSDFGLQTYMINGVRSSKGAVKPSHLLPLNLLDLVVYHKSGSGLQRIKELRCQIILNQLHSDMLKRSVAVFIVEVLSNVLQTEEAETGLYQFLEASVNWIEHTKSTLSLFPHFFLVHLSNYLGIYPQESKIGNDAVFDMLEGTFTTDSTAGLQRMNQKSSDLLKSLMQSKADELALIHTTRTQRQLLLQDLITYYKLHDIVPGVIRSHSILNELFDSN